MKRVISLVALCALAAVLEGAAAQTAGGAAQTSGAAAQTAGAGTSAAVVRATPGPAPAVSPAAPAHASPSAPPAPTPGFAISYDIHAKGMVAGLYNFSVSRSGAAYEAHASRKMTGLVRMAVGNKQDYQYEARGVVSDAGVQPISYGHTGGKKNRHVQVDFTTDDIVTTANPPMGMGAPPATRAQRVGSIDQLSSILAMSLAQGDPCARTLHVYLDGRSRFDLVMTPNGVEKVSSSAYRGAARRCSVQFRPISGFSDPQAPATLTFLFAPVGAIYAPILIAMPTDDAGIVTLEARSFKIAGA